ncbi:MAG TPA: flippase-like domain-containing protein, partial [Isosphaeraceae bacterium]|nr:flippase-like domain-containing protein [Isosphaeraceae bacterium]
MTLEQSPPSGAKRRAIGSAVNFALVVLAFALLGLVLWQNRDKIREVFSHPLDLRKLALGVLIFQISLIITYLRWYLLVRVIEPRFTLRSTLLLGFIGYVFNLVIPGAVGGDVVKAAYLARMHIRKTQAIASMVIDRILGLLGLFILAAVAGVLGWGLATPKVRS